MKFCSLKTTFLALCCFTTITACDKDKDGIHISGFTMYDGAGDLFGHEGPEDKDWTFSNDLSEKELDLFDFMPAGITLDSTLEGTTTTGIRPFPNPIAYDQSYAATFSEKVVLKLVVVNNKMEVLAKTALKFKGAGYTRIDFSDRTRFPNKSSYRIYYSYSAAGKPNFASGYGDIRICESSGNWQDCFR